MRFNARRASLALPGVTGVARVGRRTAALLPRLRTGDVAVLDQPDLDRVTAQAIVDKGVVAVVNSAPMVSGRYASLGPELLTEAGVIIVDGVGVDVFERVKNDSVLRIVDGAVHVTHPNGQTEVVASGRELDAASLPTVMEQARTGLGVQLDTLAEHTGDFLRREQDLLLDGRGLPDLACQVEGRPAIVVEDARHEDLRAIGQFVREQAPVVVAIGRAADDLIGLSWVPDIIVVTSGDPSTVPQPDALRIAKDVVVLAGRGSNSAEIEAVEDLGVTVRRVETTATAEDVALLLLDNGGASLVVGVGLRSRLEDFLDREQTGAGSTFATRLKVGSRLVDVSAVTMLYAGRTRPLHLALVVASGLVALMAAIAVTPVGHAWAHEIVDYFQGLI